MWGDWKLVQLKVATDRPSEFELFNVTEDVSETRNVASQHPDKVRQLATLLDDAHVPNDRYPLFASERSGD